MFFYFILNKKALESESGVHVTLDLCVHAWITAFHLDCSVTGNQPRPVVRVAHVALTMTEKVEQCICIYVLPGTWALMLRNLWYDIQKTFGNEAMGHTQVKEWTSVESDEHSRGSSTSRNNLMIETVPSVMLNNW